MSWWKDYIKQQMEKGREIGRRKRFEHEEKLGNLLKRKEKKKDEDKK